MSLKLSPNKAHRRTNILSFTLDMNKTVELLEEAADAGLADAQFKLSLMHLKGKHIEKDFPPATLYFQRISLPRTTASSSTGAPS